METEVHGDATIRRRVGERSMQCLTVGHGQVAWATYQRDRAGQALVASVLVDQFFDVYLARGVRSWHDPDAISGGASPQLELKVEAMDTGIPVRVVPVDLAVLVPRDRWT